MGKYNNRDIMKDLDSFCKPVTESQIDFHGIMWLFNRYTRAHLKEGDEQIDMRWVYLMTERLIAGVRCILRVNRSVFTDKLITCHGDLDQ